MPKFTLQGDALSQAERLQWMNEEKSYHDKQAHGHSQEIPGFSSAHIKFHLENVNIGLDELLQCGGRILDFGCADGKALATFGGPFEYHGVDVSGELLSLAKKEWPDGQFKQIDDPSLIPFDDGYFSGITCLSVLHHVPGVDRILCEFYRMLAPGGWILIREPLTDMTRLNGSRSGLSPKERGIPPIYIFEKTKELGLSLEKVQLNGLAGLNQLEAKLPHQWPLQQVAYSLDHFLCSFYNPLSIRYHRKHWWQKFAPTYASYILRKNTSTHVS